MAANPIDIGHDTADGIPASDGEITRTLAELRRGESGALDRLVPLLYDELRRMARGRLRSERQGHTLDTTALVHESYLKLVTQHGLQPEDRAAFFAAASNTMRRILVDHARARRREKRGGGEAPIPVDDMDLLLDDRTVEETLALEDALAKLEVAHPRAARIFEQRLFGGLELEAIAEAERISLRTIRREWHVARAWLRMVVGGASDPATPGSGR